MLHKPTGEQLNYTVLTRGKPDVNLSIQWDRVDLLIEALDAVRPIHLSHVRFIIVMVVNYKLRLVNVSVYLSSIYTFVTKK